MTMRVPEEYQRIINKYLARESDPMLLEGDYRCTDCDLIGDGCWQGIHVWEFMCPYDNRMRLPVVGMVDKTPDGDICDSWTWNVRSFKTYRNGVLRPGKFPLDPLQNTPRKFYMVLDFNKGHLVFFWNDEYFGPAFTGLRGDRKLYPNVLVVNRNYPRDKETYPTHHCSIRYIGSFIEVKTLHEIAANTVLRQLGEEEKENKINQLNLPSPVKRYLLYKD